jgi:levansucrase
MKTSHWSAQAIAAIGDSVPPSMPVIDPASVRPLLPGIHLWDLWPVQERDGRVAEIADGALYMLLSAPVMDDPDARHAIARIRLVHKMDGTWRDLGNLLPDGFAPGSREWAGSAIVSAAHDGLTLYFTAAGHRGETVVSFDQRLFETCAQLDVVDGVPMLGGWSDPVESVVADGLVYTRDMAGGGAIGTIKAFRDPAWFRDPFDGAEYLLFTASLAGSASLWNGAIGLARRQAGRWVAGAPLIDADGVNNELERPHILLHDNHYYCFWSTQRKVFADGGPAGPNGLYGMVADRMTGPWRPLNGTGLVLANPEEAPFQAYSWLVLGDLSVLSFVDMPGLSAAPRNPEEARRHFGGTPAEPVRLILDADHAALA